MNLNENTILGIIPSRYHSSRLEGKPLSLINGKPMIQHVYERACNVLSNVIVATDDQRIQDAIRSFNGEVIMTSSDHSTGTNRCLEALTKWEENNHTKADIVLNIQGDEPLLSSDHLTKTLDCFNDDKTTIATLGLKIQKSSDLDEGKVYLIKDLNDFAIYFSRYPIPYLRDVPKEKWSLNHTYYQHIGIYGFKRDSLIKFASMPESTLEKSEKLEQLRWLENGEKIKVNITDQPCHPVDTQEDLNKVRQLFKLKDD